MTVLLPVLTEQRSRKQTLLVPTLTTLGSLAMASCEEPQEGEESYSLGACRDRRVHIKDPRENDSKPPHLVHRTIFPVLAACQNDKCEVFDEAYLGTCFVLDPLYDIFGKSKRKCHYFATAGHNLICHKCKSYRAVGIAIEWKENSTWPSKYLTDGPPELITQSGGPGWVRVSEIDFKPIGDKDNRARYHYDFGVIAVYADRCDPATRKIIDDAKQMDQVFVAAESTYKRSLAYLCGYPYKVECEQDEACTEKVRTSEPKSLRTYDVRGSMFWMPLDPGVSVEDTEWSDVPPPDIDSNQTARSTHQRSTVAVYSFPQGHGDESSATYPTTVPELQSKLYRYYIDCSDGQSGSPVYVERKIDGRTKYCVVGIHVGEWELTESEGKSCNVCMRLDAALEQMEAEGWPEWARNKGSKAGNQSVELGVQGKCNVPWLVIIDYLYLSLFNLKSCAIFMDH